ncbi:uncharacterized protein LOC135392398 [Ornithodoros turicata]|uniref:uncharacterized protein LOC135392398 n=1 Tax=Ornithodoros turicata TaxID=34597 RepID=UPI0031389F6B
MEGWDTVKDLLLQGDYLVRIDLKDAYLSVPIAKRDRPWLCFLHQGRCYQWNVLPFGLCSAPRVFTKLMKPVVAHRRSQGIRLVIFLDDILLMDQSPGRLRSSMQTVVNLLHSLGFVVNQTKSHLTPTQTLTFLGFEIMTVPLALCPPVDKGLAIKQEIDSILGESIGVRALASLIGRLNATSLGVLAAPLHLRSLQSLLHRALQIGSYETTVRLSSAAREDLGWWRTVLLSHPRRSLHESSVLQTIQTDSSLRGWGAHSQGLVVGQQWTTEQAQLHINELELIAAFLGLQALGRASDQGCILLQLDNRAAVAAINRMGSTRSSSLNKVALQLWSWCLKRGLTVRAQHIPGRLNAVADRASRVHFDNSSWKLHVPTFRKIDSLWDPIKMDLFADLSNHEVPHYFSWKPDPGAAGVDTFTQIWSGPGLYAFPPFNLVNRCLRKMCESGGDLILVAPTWPSQPWYPSLLRLACEELRLIQPLQDLIRNPQGVFHPLVGHSLLLAVWKLTSDTLRIRAFWERLQGLSPRLGERHPARLQFLLAEV